MDMVTTEMLNVTRKTYFQIKAEIVKAIVNLEDFQESEKTTKKSIETGVGAATEREDILQSIIFKKKRILKQCNIVSMPEGTDTIKIGHRVKVSLDGKICEFILEGVSVRREDINVVSSASPIGKAILGQKNGYKTMFRKQELQVEEISLQN